MVGLLWCLGIRTIYNQTSSHKFEVMEGLHSTCRTLFVLVFHKSVEQAFSTGSTQNLYTRHLADSAHVLHELYFIREVR